MDPSNSVERIDALEAQLRTVTAYAVAADRLVKALATILSMRDITILQDMKDAFSVAIAKRKPGEAPPDAWDLIKEELELIAEIVREDRAKG